MDKYTILLVDDEEDNVGSFLDLSLFFLYIFQTIQRYRNKNDNT